jgi:hypothetical protein
MKIISGSRTHASDSGGRRPLTIAESERAIYVDFEGNQGRDPSFVGILADDLFEQVVVEPALEAGARGRRPADYRLPQGYEPLSAHSAPSAALRCGDLRAICRGMLARASRESRHIVAWSNYEKDVFLGVAAEDSADIESLFVDAKLHARRWKRRVHPHITFPRTRFGGTHRLKYYFSLIGYRLPSYFGERQAAGRISFVRNALATHSGDFAAITPTAKAKWTKVLDYNWHDCNGLREVMLHVFSPP